MATKTISTFFSPLTLPNNSIFNPRIPSTCTKPTLILCRAPQPQQANNESPRSNTQLPDSRPGTEGTGAAAPTPGDRFLERQRSFDAVKLLLKENKKKKKREKPLKVSLAVACCYGCGAPLQTSEPDAPGYVDTETYALVSILYYVYGIYIYIFSLIFLWALKCLV